MSKYDVYGVGNALVDSEFEVDDAFFDKHGIEKGIMTLVDEVQQDLLLKDLEDNYKITKRAGGGSAANTLYALSQFGGKAYLSCKVADDTNGDFYIEQLGHNNIQTNPDTKGSGTTGRCVAMITPDAERTMHTFLGVSETISEKELDLKAAAQSEYIYLEGYLVTSPSAKAAITELKEFAEQNDVATAMTFSDPSMLEYFKDNVNEVLGSGVDLLFCNEREASLWSGESELEQICAALKSKAARFAITRGAEGALLFDGEQYIDVAPHPVKAIDTNGAGDMFAGAFLYGITQGRSFAAAGNLASLASATIVSTFGPRLPADDHGMLVRTVFDD